MPESEAESAPDVEAEIEPIQVVAPPPAELDLPPVQVDVPDGDLSGEAPGQQPGLPDSLLPEGAYIVVHD